MPVPYLRSRKMLFANKAELSGERTKDMLRVEA